MNRLECEQAHASAAKISSSSSSSSSHNVNAIISRLPSSHNSQRHDPTDNNSQSSTKTNADGETKNAYRVLHHNQHPLTTNQQPSTTMMTMVVTMTLRVRSPSTTHRVVTDQNLRLPKQPLVVRNQMCKFLTTSYLIHPTSRISGSSINSLPRTRSIHQFPRSPNKLQFQHLTSPVWQHLSTTKDLTHEPMPSKDPTTLDNIKAQITTMTAARIITAPDKAARIIRAHDMTVDPGQTAPDMTIIHAALVRDIMTARIIIAHETVHAVIDLKRTQTSTRKVRDRKRRSRRNSHSRSRSSSHSQSHRRPRSSGSYHSRHN